MEWDSAKVCNKLDSVVFLLADFVVRHRGRGEVKEGRGTCEGTVSFASVLQERWVLRYACFFFILIFFLEDFGKLNKAEMLLKQLNVNLAASVESVWHKAFPGQPIPHTLQAHTVEYCAYVSYLVSLFTFLDS